MTQKTAAEVAREYDDHEWVRCWNCDDGMTGHDCGEDCCACLYPEDNVVCDICDGEGGWFKPESAAAKLTEGK